MKSVHIWKEIDTFTASYRKGKASTIFVMGKPFTVVGKGQRKQQQKMEKTTLSQKNEMQQ